MVADLDMNGPAENVANAGLLEALPAAVFAVDGEGGLTFWNRAAERLWGRRPAVGERNFPKAWRWPDGRAIGPDEEPIAAVLRGDEIPAATEIVSLGPDGKAVPQMAYLRPLRDRQGALTGILALLVDISERTHAELDRERLAAIVSSSNDAIIGKTLDGIITSWNAGATRMYGYTAEEMLGRSVTVLMPEEIRDQEEAILARLRRGERIEHFDTVRLTRDGRRIDVSLAISPVRDGSGRIVGASKVARDISERKRAEELQRLLFEELNHRVKNTLATIQAIASQSLRRGPDPSSFVASFNGRVQALARAHDLLVADEFRGTGVADLVREQVLHGPGDARVHAAGPDVRLGPRSAVQLALVLHELATNARKYGALSRPEGRLTIEWRLDVGGESGSAVGQEVGQEVGRKVGREAGDEPDGGRRLLLAWSESGVSGLRAPDGRGPGFGTTLINRSLESAGGSARLTYEPHGLVCVLDLPLVDEGPPMHVPAAPPLAPAVGALASDGAPDLSGRRVLVVEDEPLVAMDVEASLAEAGCTVVGPAASVARALALVASEPLDAAVLDANLAGSPVDAVAEELAARGVPFAFVTGYGREALPARHAAAPMLTKPVPPAVLVAMVANLVAAREGER